MLISSTISRKYKIPSVTESTSDLEARMFESRRLVRPEVFSKTFLQLNQRSDTAFIASLIVLTVNQSWHNTFSLRDIPHEESDFMNRNSNYRAALGLLSPPHSTYEAVLSKNSLEHWLCWILKYYQSWHSSSVQLLEFVISKSQPSSSFLPPLASYLSSSKLPNLRKTSMLKIDVSFNRSSL